MAARWLSESVKELLQSPHTPIGCKDAGLGYSQLFTSESLQGLGSDIHPRAPRVFHKVGIV